MAGIFLSLKLRLLMNRAVAVKRDPQRGQTAVVAVLVLGFLTYKYGGEVYESVSMTGTLPDSIPLLAQISMSIVFLWIMLPLAYGGRRDLDVRKFQVLPIRPIALAVGLASTFIISPGAWLTAAAAVVLSASFPGAAANLPLLTLSGLALVLMCVVTGQVVSTGADLLGRQRHARDLLTTMTFGLAAVPVALFFLLKSHYADPVGGAAVAGVFAWVPPAWPGVALAAAGRGRRESRWQRWVARSSSSAWGRGSGPRSSRVLCSRRTARPIVPAVTQTRSHDSPRGSRRIGEGRSQHWNCACSGANRPGFRQSSFRP
jgi:hypothetical protein